MVYLDYAATTPVNEEVLDSFVKCTKNYIANPNSIHLLGIKANELLSSATNQIADILKIKSSEIIYTSGSSEANNLAIKGILNKYSKRGKHIITTRFEHSSIYAPLNYMTKQGFEIDFVNTDESGIVDLEHLKSLLRDDTILVSIDSVNSEVGIVQPIEEIGKILKSYPKCFFHSDMTASVGKIHIPFDNIDLATFSPHKFYGLKGIGILYKKEEIVIEPLIHGGKSTTIYRSGTPVLPLVVSTAKALRLAYENMKDKYNYVKELNTYLVENLKKEDNIFINSNSLCLPHIVNFSLLNIKPETVVHALEKYDIFISTKTACSSKDTDSKAILALTSNKELAKTSLRVSLSHLTTKEEVDTFLKYLKIVKNELNFRK